MSMSRLPSYQTIAEPMPPPPPLRLAWFYDMDACRGPTGVTRHALAQLERLARRDGDDVRLTLVSGRIAEPDGLATWERFDNRRRRELPLRTRDALRLWRLLPWPPLELWTGRLDWVYCPAEFFVPTYKSRLAVTSHDILQDLTYGGPRRRALLDRVFGRADLVLSVSRFNTDRLLDAFPSCRDKVAIVPNGADDLFFQAPTESERRGVRSNLGLPAALPYLLSVANFQPRKNLARLIRAAGRLPEVASGELAIVLIGDGSEDQARPIREAIATLGGRAVVRLPGYRQGPTLRAAYAEATALVFPSTCESFGIPAVEAMAQGCPVALAKTTALPEVGGPSGWYFDPEDEEALTATLREILDRADERARRVALGRLIAEALRWDRSHEHLMTALRSRAGTGRPVAW